MLVNVNVTCDGDVEMGIGQVASVGLGEQMRICTKGKRRERQIKFYSRPAHTEVYGFLHSMMVSSWTVNDIWGELRRSINSRSLTPSARHRPAVSLTYLTDEKVKGDVCLIVKTELLV